MSQFEHQINQAFASFYAKEYLSCCETLMDAYTSLLEREDEQLPAAYYMEKSLTTLEELAQLPDLEMTDYVVSILAEERAFLFQQQVTLWNTRMGTLSRLVGLLQDYRSIIIYWDEYLGGIGQQPYPTITIGIASRGHYILYENLYEKAPVFSC